MRGSSSFKSEAELLQCLIDRRIGALHSQQCTQLGRCGVGMLANQARKAMSVDLRHAGAADLPRRRLAAVAISLSHPPRPGGADSEDFGDLLRCHSALIRHEHSIAEVL